ncbi:MAG: phosphoenolpyruvate carboxykinase (GTP) [Planctomycetaceae bacterium]|nr:phosphoenolpyruvate carboxykinase (GTP) [Planctomycetaceae bacterium]
MDTKHKDILQSKLDAVSMANLEKLANDKLNAFVADAVSLCQPDAVKVLCDDPADMAWVRRQALAQREETALKTPGHSVHFDGFQSAMVNDQGRDTEVTKYLVPKGMTLGKRLRSIDRDEGLTEIRGYFTGSMKGRTMFVRFYSLGPLNSAFSTQCAQITDSAYVVHSEDLLYRPGYEQFKKLAGSGDFFRFLHATGAVDERLTSSDVEHKRIYIDITQDMVLSVNTQYAGNTVGLKKLALRLAIQKADREGWLAEHMFIMGVHGPGGRVTYFTGAFPSACGKTSTAMLGGETILGDDLAYLRIIDGQARCVNTEAGIFGIIRDVNPKDDPAIYDLLTKPGEVIFSNVLVNDSNPYWLGMGRELPAQGENFAGAWTQGMKDPTGVEIPAAHPNARYTVRLTDLANLDPKWNDPAGVVIGGIMYGGRDSDTSVPVQESFNWTHGIVTMGASLESETTAATVGKTGVRTFDLMSIMQFVAIPIGRYIANNLNFGDKLAANAPRIYGTNYYLKNAGGEYLNTRLDKMVWVKWMELRSHNEVQAIEAPTGRLPLYQDLAPLFKKLLDKDYTQQDYVEQFTIRIPENLAKIDRIEAIYRNEPEIPPAVLQELAAQRKRLETLQAAKGDYVSPLNL